MHDGRMLDEIDFQLINALQIAPRMPWSALAPVLRTDTSTVSRRWARLRESGLAWTTCYVLPQRMQVPDAVNPLRASTAMVEVRCSAGTRDAIVAAVAQLPIVINVEFTSGPRELALTVSAASPSAIDQFVSSSIATIPGVDSTSIQFTRTMYREGSEFDLGVLTASQRRLIQAHLQSATPVPPAPPSPLTDRVIRALQPNVRRPAAEIADELDISVAVARRVITQLMHTDWVRMRADFAHDVVGWNASVLMWMNVPQDQLQSVATNLALMPSVRLCSSTLGPSNLILMLWMKELDELDDIELKLLRVFPQARVMDRWMIPRVAKRMGTLFDESGRRSGYVHVPLPSASPH